MCRERLPQYPYFVLQHLLPTTLLSRTISPKPFISVTVPILAPACEAVVKRPINARVMILILIALRYIYVLPITTKCCFNGTSSAPVWLISYVLPPPVTFRLITCPSKLAPPLELIVIALPSSPAALAADSDAILVDVTVIIASTPSIVVFNILLSPSISKVIILPPASEFHQC